MNAMRAEAARRPASRRGWLVGSWGRGLLASVAIFVLGVGCVGDVRIEDDLDFELFQAKLHTPYVVGAQVTIRVSRRHRATVSGWRVDADDPAVFRISPNPGGDAESLYVEGVAVREGETRLRVYDESGHDVATRQIAVGQPDRVELVPAGLIKVRGDDAPALSPDAPIRILAGGTATFEVRYRRQGERLFGNGALTATADATDVTLTPRQTYLFENREWLSVSAEAIGTFTLSLSVGGQVVTTYSVAVVDESAIASVAIEAEQTEKAEDGDLLYLLGHARDADGNDIWGVEMDWAVDGVAEPGDGDLYFYDYAEGKEHTVSASRAGGSDSVMVQMSGGGVTTSNHAGCQAVGSARGAVPLLLFLLGWMGLRRRRLGRAHGTR